MGDLFLHPPFGKTYLLRRRFCRHSNKLQFPEPWKHMLLIYLSAFIPKILLMEEIRLTTWDIYSPLSIMGNLPYQLVSLPDFWTINSTLQLPTFDFMFASSIISQPRGTSVCLAPKAVKAPSDMSPISLAQYGHCHVAKKGRDEDNKNTWHFFAGEITWHDIWMKVIVDVDTYIMYMYIYIYIYVHAGFRGGYLRWLYRPCSIDVIHSDIVYDIYHLESRWRNPQKVAL